MPRIHGEAYEQPFASSGIVLTIRTFLQLTNDILSSLVEQSLADKPTGSLSIVIKAFDTLVVLLGDEIIALTSRSLSKLLNGCFQPPLSAAASEHSKEDSANSADMDRLPSSNYRAELYAPQLASLLCGVCSRIKAHPDLLPIFFQHKRLAADRGKRNGSANPSYSASGTAVTTLEILKSPTASHRSLSTASSREAASDSPSLTNATESSAPLNNAGGQHTNARGAGRQYELPLLKYLLKYIHRDGRTGEFARAGILFLVDLAMAQDGSSQINVNGASDNKAARWRTLVPSTSAGRPFLQSKASQPEASTSIPLRSELLDYIARSDLAEMVGAGIGALYGLLPSQIYVAPLPLSLAGAPAVELSTHLSTADVFDADVQEVTDQQEYLQGLRNDGYAVQGDKELQGQIDGWCKVVEFAQDLVRRAQTANGGTELSVRVLASIRYGKQSAPAAHA